MPTKLFASMGFALCSFIFYIMVLVMYINKRRTKKFDNKPFTFMFIFTFILLMNEFLYIFAMYAELDANISFISTKLLCYSYILLGIIWFAYLIIYIWTIVKKYDPPKEKYDKIVVISVVLLAIVMAIISLFSSIQYPTSSSNLYVFSGSAVYTIYAIGIFVLTMVVFALVRIGSKIPAHQKNPMYFCILILIVLNAIQIIFDFDCNFLTFFYTIILITLYFTIESQDYRLMDYLEKKKIEAEVADKAQTEFLTNMSHEIRTPLNTILGFSESLLSEKELNKETVIRDISMVNDASITLLDLINNILDISRLESGKEKIEEKEYSIETLVNEIDSSITSKHSNNELRFIIDVNTDIPKSFQGDYLKMYKCIIGVVNNAFKYTNFGNITLSISGTKVEEGVFELLIIVSNTGHEMSNKKFDIDFNDFVKIGTTTDNTIDNEALGLIISKKYVELLGGSIEFINKTGEGTKYILKINQKISNEEKVGKIKRTNNLNAKENNSLDCTGKKVLVVDDNILNIKLSSRLLERFNFTIDSATSGAECIEKVKSENYDLIFLDHMMPEMDGLETIRKLLKMDKFDIPIIALTANNSPGLREKYLSYGFYDYLSKPININDLNKLIIRIFEEK